MLKKLPNFNLLSFGSFLFVPPSLLGAYYLQPPDARAMFLHYDLQYKDTCSVMGGGA